MSSNKNIMMRGMDKIMLSCDNATYLITRNEYESISCLKKMQLSMHLMGCKYCRRFAEQSKYITSQLNKLKVINNKNNSICLSKEQKSKINKAIESQAKNF